MDQGGVQRLTLIISSTINSVTHNISKVLTSVLSATPHIKNPQDRTNKIKGIKMDQEMVAPHCSHVFLPQKKSQQDGNNFQMTPNYPACLTKDHFCTLLNPPPNTTYLGLGSQHK